MEIIRSQITQAISSGLQASPFLECGSVSFGIYTQLICYCWTSPRGNTVDLFIILSAPMIVKTSADTAVDFVIVRRALVATQLICLLFCHLR